jgi:sigma54-dependent transcription regulator
LFDAGCKLFAVSREQKTTASDADHLDKYLARLDLSWRNLDNGG